MEEIHGWLISYDPRSIQQAVSFEAVFLLGCTASQHKILQRLMNI